MPILAFLSNLGMGGGGSPRVASGGSYTIRHRRKREEDEPIRELVLEQTAREPERQAERLEVKAKPETSRVEHHEILALMREILQDEEDVEMLVLH